MNSPQEHPSEQQWDELAAGLIRGADAESMMEHASWCEPCAALLRELERMHWNISRTAQALGISRNTLYRKIHKHNIVLEQ